MGFQTDLTAGLFALVVNAGVAEESGGSGDLPLLVERFLPTAPDAAVALSTYGVSDDPVQAQSVVGVQVLCRMPGTDPRPTDDLQDSIFDLLQGLHQVVLSTGVRVIEVERHSSVPLGRDDLNRWVQSDNYYVTVWRPAPNRL